MQEQPKQQAQQRQQKRPNQQKRQEQQERQARPGQPKTPADRARQQAFARYLADQIAACQRRGRALTADDRVDEGRFEKIRANVYEIFQTVLGVAERVGGEDDAARRRFFWQKARQIPQSWQEALQKARQQGDDEKTQIESIKLEAIHEIQEMCRHLWGGTV